MNQLTVVVYITVSRNFGLPLYCAFMGRLYISALLNLEVAMDLLQPV